MREKETRISIGLQARFSNTRLPRKIEKKIGAMTILERVMLAIDRSVKYINKNENWPMVVTPYILAPEEETSEFQDRREGWKYIFGDMNNVLSRYVKMAEIDDSDYIVRITSDCPLIPTSLITQCIKIAKFSKSDYVTNTFPSFETFFDGSDVEVLSRRMLDYLTLEAKSKEEKEHVTLYLKKKEIPRRFKIDHVFNNVDLSGLKLSVDTIDDYRRVESIYNRNKDKIERWTNYYGSTTVHRF